MPTIQILRQVTGNQPLIQGTQTITSGQQIDVDEVIPAGSSGLSVAFAFDNLKLQALVILADKDMTAVSGLVTLTLKAGIPWVWDKASGYFSNPFGAPVTAFACTTGASDTRFQGVAIVDPT